MWLLDLDDASRHVSWCLPSFQVTIRGRKFQQPLRHLVKVEGSSKGWDCCHHEKTSGDRSWLCCWLRAAGWMSNEWLAGVSVGGWMGKRNLMFAWRKPEWWITQRPRSPGILRSPNLLKRGERVIFRVYLFHCWRWREWNVKAVCQFSGREITNSFLSGVTELGLLSSEENYFTKHCHYEEERN